MSIFFTNNSMASEKKHFPSKRCHTTRIYFGTYVFLIYINDINNSNTLNLLTNAEDYNIYSSNNNIMELDTEVCTDVNKLLSNWFRANKLTKHKQNTLYDLLTIKHSLDQ